MNRNEIIKLVGFDGMAISNNTDLLIACADLATEGYVDLLDKDGTVYVKLTSQGEGKLFILERS